MERAEQDTGAGGWVSASAALMLLGTSGREAWRGHFRMINPRGWSPEGLKVEDTLLGALDKG